MYEKYLEQLEEAGKIRNLKERSISYYKNYVSYFLKYQNKNPKELTCQDVRAFFACEKRGRTESHNSESLQFCHPFFLSECPAYPLG